ncbi:MAG: cytidylate kinase-like family protein [Trichlorobacter sp.]|nr:cytidylate kinase-like family protein [Trichlorobacter sp.]
MSVASLIPSIDHRLGGLIEVARRQNQGVWHEEEPSPKPTITISREFGCEAYPVAELLRLNLEKKTGENWTLMDKALLDEVAKNHNLSSDVLKNLGEKNRFLDEFLATFSSRWKSDKDYYRLLTRHIVALAEQGNVIIVGRGASIVTRNMKNCFHFRIFASMTFKKQSIANRLSISEAEAEAIVEKKQKERDNFIRSFLDFDPYNLAVYHLAFNNDRNSASKTADMITEYLLA